jgi:hypothetical protein
MRRLLPFALVGALVLAACGSSGSSGGGATSTTTEPGTTAERAIARAGLITDSDLNHWAKVKSNASEATDLILLAKDVPECTAFTRGNVQEQVNGRSPGYQRGATIADSSVVVFATDAEALAQLELYRDPTIVDCLRAVYLKLLKTTGVTKVDVSPVAPEGVTNGFGFLVSAEIPEGAGTSRTVTTGIQGVQVGRALSSINVTGTQAEIARVASSTLPNIERRLRAAQQ